MTKEKNLVDELRRENAELKKLLKESFESFPTKRMADRIYSIDGIERPDPTIKWMMGRSHSNDWLEKWFKNISWQIAYGAEE